MTTCAYKRFSKDIFKYFPWFQMKYYVERLGYFYGYQDTLVKIIQLFKNMFHWLSQILSSVCYYHYYQYLNILIHCHMIFRCPLGSIEVLNTGYCRFSIYTWPHIKIISITTVFFIYFLRRNIFFCYIFLSNIFQNVNIYRSFFSCFIDDNWCFCLVIVI